MIKNLLNALKRIASEPPSKEHLKNHNGHVMAATLAQCQSIALRAHADFEARGMRIGASDGIEFGMHMVDKDKPALGMNQMFLSLEGRVACGQFQEIMRRALNTWEPDHTPKWAMDIMDRLTGTPTPPAGRDDSKAVQP